MYGSGIPMLAVPFLESQTVLIHREGASFMQDHDSLNFTCGISLRINEPLKQDRCELIQLDLTYGIPLENKRAS
jgi:hypothetical protein